MHEAWEEDSVLMDFLFTQPFAATKQYNIAIGQLVGFLIGGEKLGIATLEFDEKSTILTIASSAITKSWRQYLPPHGTTRYRLTMC